MADQDQQRYSNQSYIPPKYGEEGSNKKRSQLKDPHVPKRSLSAFFWYSMDERPKVEVDGRSAADVAKELARRWLEADPETKAKYAAIAEHDQARYDREMEAYRRGSRP